MAVTLAQSAVPLHQIVMLFILCGDERAPFFVRGFVALLVAANAVQASERQVEGTVILYISYAGLCDMRACAVLSLVFVDDFLLGNTELFTTVVLVSGLPRVKLTCYFIVDIGAYNLNISSGTI